MRYSGYFRKVAEIHQTDPAEAERLLREAESLASDLIPIDRILCAKCWRAYLHNEDNALRCLLEIECCTTDTRGLLEISIAYWSILRAKRQAHRCFKKAVAAAQSPDDHDRIREFVNKYSSHYLQELSDDG